MCTSQPSLGRCIDVRPPRLVPPHGKWEDVPARDSSSTPSQGKPLAWNLFWWTWHRHRRGFRFPLEGLAVWEGLGKCDSLRVKPWRNVPVLSLNQKSCLSKMLKMSDVPNAQPEPRGPCGVAVRDAAGMASHAVCSREIGGLRCKECRALVVARGRREPQGLGSRRAWGGARPDRRTLP